MHLHIHFIVILCNIPTFTIFEVKIFVNFGKFKFLAWISWELMNFPIFSDLLQLATNKLMFFADTNLLFEWIYSPSQREMNWNLRVLGEIHSAMFINGDNLAYKTFADFDGRVKRLLSYFNIRRPFSDTLPFSSDKNTLSCSYGSIQARKFVLFRRGNGRKDVIPSWISSPRYTYFGSKKAWLAFVYEHNRVKLYFRYLLESDSLKFEALIIW